MNFFKSIAFALAMTNAPAVLGMQQPQQQSSIDQLMIVAMQLLSVQKDHLHTKVSGIRNTAWFMSGAYSAAEIAKPHIVLHDVQNGNYYQCPALNITLTSSADWQAEIHEVDIIPVTLNSNIHTLIIPCEMQAGFHCERQQGGCLLQ